MSVLAIFFGVILGVVFIYAWAEIFAKVGYSRWLSLVMLIPIANIVTFLFFAFSKWPVYDYVQKGWDIKRLKEKQRKIEQQIQALSGQNQRQQEIDRLLHSHKP